MTHARGRSLALLALALLPVGSGCYLTRSALEEARILARRRPIAQLVRDENVDPVVRRKLVLVLSARDFARDALGLRTDNSFTSYSDVRRDTLLLVLSAAYPDRLAPYTWRFPIVGRIPYKGFFDFDGARAEARRLRTEGFDVYLRPSDAFSTLGWFDDPLLSTTLARDTLDLVETVVHELTHTTFYAKDAAQFNESFASFVGARGAALFFTRGGQPRAATMVLDSWADQKLLSAFWAGLAARLDSAFARHPSDRSARLAARDTVYAAAREELVRTIGPRLRTIGPRYVERVPLDNASLLARLIYSAELGMFDDVLEREGGDLRRAIARIIGLARSRPADPAGALREWMARAATTESLPEPAAQERAQIESR